MISVIIPVYNTASVLPQCIESVLRQQYADFELILVDDGSTDGSADVCDDYACRDARVTVIHQPNAGPSSARNAALDVAQGDYVVFIDSDDVVHSGYLGTLLSEAETHNADIVQAPYQLVPAAHRTSYDAARLSAPLPDNARRVCLDADQALLAMFYQQGTADSSPCKLFRRSLFEGLRFPADIRVYEDLYLMAQLYGRMQRMVWIDMALYFYFKQDSGTLCSLSTQRSDAFDVLDRLEAQYLVTGRRDLVRAARERRFSVALNILRLLSHQPHTDANITMAHRCWQHIASLRSESLRDSHARIKNRVVAALSYLIWRQ